MAKITGLGGIFFKSKDPAALSTWYRDVLGLDVSSWGGAKLGTGTPYTVWTPFESDSDHFEPGTSAHMINFAVDDLDAFVAQLEIKGVPILRRDDSEAYGRFAWLVDPDGTKIELWQPPA